MEQIVHWSISTWSVFIGVITGFCVRLNILQVDYRQYPSYPYGFIIHIALGMVAAALGAVSVPALFSYNYIAVTFLALAAQQFREVRRMERETLTRLDATELVPRGINYIESMAMVFEGRNYIVIAAAFLSALFTMLSDHVSWGVVFSIPLVAVSRWLLRQPQIRDIAEVQPVEITFQGTNVYIDQSFLTNVGIERNREVVQKHGLGFVIQPKQVRFEIILSNLGQQQAVLHDASTVLGVYRDPSTPSFLPLTRRDLPNGRILVLLLPLFQDLQSVSPQTGKLIIERVPILENAVRSHIHITGFLRRFFP